jgi:hypothetical protein
VNDDGVFITSTENMRKDDIVTEQNISNQHIPQNLTMNRGFIEDKNPWQIMREAKEQHEKEENEKLQKEEEMKAMEENKHHEVRVIKKDNNDTKNDSIADEKKDNKKSLNFLEDE